MHGALAIQSPAVDVAANVKLALATIATPSRRHTMQSQSLDAKGLGH